MPRAQWLSRTFSNATFVAYRQGVGPADSLRKSILWPSLIRPARYNFGHMTENQTENRLKKLIMIWRALHEYVNFVHDPEKQYVPLTAPYRNRRETSYLDSTAGWSGLI